MPLSLQKLMQMMEEGHIHFGEISWSTKLSYLFVPVSALEL